MDHHAAPASYGFPFSIVFLALTTLLYWRGWFRLRSISSGIPAWRVVGFFVGLFSIWVAVASPIAGLDHELLTFHMIQHLLLMTVAAPLLLLGAPAMLLLHGLPRQFTRTVIDALRKWPLVRQSGKGLTHSGFCWLAATVTLMGWHVPEVFAVGLQSETWHVVEHTCFFGAGLLFWWPVIQPWPSVSTGPGWSTVVYLFLATLPCDILSGFLVFSDRVVYSVYLSAPRRFGISVLADQQCAGALMWTCVTIIYLVAGTILATRLLSPQGNPQSVEAL